MGLSTYVRREQESRPLLFGTEALRKRSQNEGKEGRRKAFFYVREKGGDGQVDR